jgi:alpha-glucosidase
MTTSTKKKKNKHQSDQPNNFIWWKHGVVYHIYPRSFRDTNGDGVGDLPGILEKLDYLQYLGVDAIWLSPIYASPHRDFGYDIEDYYSIDPIFGTLKDFKTLIKEAQKRNIHVIMDMVMNHTSNQHPWFLESRSSLDNPKRDWYIWHAGVNGKVPNNWKNNFGSKAWTLDKTTGEYYYHSFFKEQPDLNWRNKELKKEFEKILRFWLDLGVGGFRFDVINMIVKDKKFRNNPSLLEIFFHRKPVYTRDQPKALKIMKWIRGIIDSYDDRMSVGEIYTLPPGDSKLAAGYLGTGKDALHLAFDFSLIFKPWDAAEYAKTLWRWYKNIPLTGWPCNVLSNHDLDRSYNRGLFSRNKQERAVIHAFLMMTLRGTPFIYYGEEIGMSNTFIPYNRIQDPLGKRYWPFYHGRDKARTPMQWDATENAGFSPVKPWLPVNSRFEQVNVQRQLPDKTSLLNYYRDLIALRRKHPSLQSGNWNLVEVGNSNVLVFTRSTVDEKTAVVLNFSNQKLALFPTKNLSGKVLLSNCRQTDTLLILKTVEVHPFEATLIHIKGGFNE